MSPSVRIPNLVVGLGNPGKKYEGSRHNVGFQVVDALASSLKVTFVSKFQALWGEAQHSGQKVFLMKPQTFMNLSGEAVSQAVQFYKWEPSSVLAISDDLDLPLGQLRLRLNGGSGGHNGLNSMIETLGSEEFARLRIGIGRPETKSTDYLLVKMPKSDQKILDDSIAEAAQGILLSLTEGIERVMNKLNQKKETT